jgi:octaprenyl-diphosphate synthase
MSAVKATVKSNGRSIKIYDPRDFPVYLPKLNSLYDDLFSGGKGFRGKLIHIFSMALSLPEKTEELLAQTIEFIHNASLLHDDLVDRSHLRRGKTTAWMKYTPEYAVLAGDYLLARVMVNLSSFGNIQLVQYTAQMISDLLEGEWLQDSLVGDFDVKLSELDRVHNLKTSSLFKWCLRAPFIAIDNNDLELHHSLEEMGSILGELFQRSDDLLDFDVRNREGKAILGDLKSGYLNSFAAFSTQNISVEARRKLRSVQSLDQFFDILGGKDIFEAQLSRFDEINRTKIGLYEHHLVTIAGKVSPELANQLKPLTEALYWRKSK